MNNRLLFGLTVLYLKLLVNGENDERNTDYRKGVALDLCILESEKGSCDRKILRYYYNVKLQKCITFIYGGCGGNPNNFNTRKECQKNCPGKFVETSKPLYCFIEPEEDKCDSAGLRYYYDWKTDDCISFFDQGCNENRNKFKFIDQCFNECRIYKLSLKMKSL